MTIYDLNASYTLFHRENGYKPSKLIVSINYFKEMQKWTYIGAPEPSYQEFVNKQLNLEILIDPKITDFKLC